MHLVQQYARSRTGCLHTRQCAQPFEQLLIERLDISAFGIFRSREIEPYFEYIRGIKAWIDLLQLPRTLEHQPGARQQHQRKCDLGYDQRAACGLAPDSTTATSATAAAILQDLTQS